MGKGSYRTEHDGNEITIICETEELGYRAWGITYGDSSLSGNGWSDTCNTKKECVEMLIEFILKKGGVK